MEKELLKVNLLAIAGSGLLLFVMGAALYAMKDSVAAYLRFFLPIPPLCVAAYVFVFNLFKDHRGVLPEHSSVVVTEVLTGTLFAAIVFGAFTACLVAGVHQLKKFV